MGGKHLSGIKSMYVNSQTCECFKIKSGVRPGCIMSPWVFNVYMDSVMKEVKVGMKRIGVRCMEEEED